MGEIWAIVLAAGESKRMNSPKMLLPFNGTTMIGKVIDNISKSKIDRTMLVTGAYSKEIIEAAGSMPVTICHNENYKNGMLSSVQCAFRSIPDDAGQALVFPGDKPWISPDDINLLIDSYRRENKGIVVPVNNKKRGHPILIDLRYRKEVAMLDPNEGLKGLARIFPGDVLEVETANPGILKDVDTPEEYLNSLNQIP